MGVGGAGKGVALLGHEAGATLRGFLALEQGPRLPTWTVKAACAGFHLVHSRAGSQWAEEGMEGVRGGKEERLEQACAPLWWVPHPLPAHMAGCALPPRGRQDRQRIKPWSLQSGRGPGCLITESLRTSCVKCVSCIPA